MSLPLEFNLLPGVIFLINVLLVLLAHRNLKIDYFGWMTTVFWIKYWFLLVSLEKIEKIYVRTVDSHFFEKVSTKSNLNNGPKATYGFQHNNNNLYDLSSFYFLGHVLLFSQLFLPRFMIASISVKILFLYQKNQQFEVFWKYNSIHSGIQF